jgi:glycosyltransferase involved in cell wall biosynthesis
MIRLADMVFCSSKSLFEKNEKRNSNTHYIPHGVDYDLFASAVSKTVQVAPEMVNLRRPVALFFGWISYDWVDIHLAKFIAREKPDWSFVYIGPYSLAKDEFDGYPNIVLIGEQPFESLPSYCRGADVAIIPFVHSELTKNCSPLKLLEYLAAGLPVVSTDIPEVRKYDDIVYVGKNMEEFLHLLERAVSERNSDRDSLVSRRMSLESWDERVELIYQVIRGKH